MKKHKAGKELESVMTQLFHEVRIDSLEEVAFEQRLKGRMKRAI